MEAADLRQKTGPGGGSHRRRLSLSSASTTEDGSAAEGSGSLENETNYALIWWSGSGRHHHHHHKRSSSYSSNSSSSSSGSPLWSSNSSTALCAPQAGVPFSWERRPGVPKQKPDAGGDVRELRRPPLADPQSSARRRRKERTDDDPFVTALVECMKDVRVSSARRRGASGYSCMRTCATVDSQIAVPRPRVPKQTSEVSKECKKKNGLQEPLLYSQSSNKSCRSETANTEVQNQRSWNVEFCRSVLHR